MKNRWAWLTLSILCLSLGFFHVVSTLPGPLHGDEIHYLVMTISLLHDGDLNLLNNYNSPEMLQLNRFPVEPHLMYNAFGRGYSSHEPGLPVLLVLPYALGGRSGTVWFMTVLAVIAAMQIFVTARFLGIRDRTAMLLTLAAAVNVPFIMMSGKVFPDMAGAALLAVACRWMLADSRRSRHVMGAVALALLPWIHIKFILFTGLVTAAWLLINRRRCRDIFSLFLPSVISMLAMAVFQHILYGDFIYTVRARSGGLGSPLPGIIGLLYDREAGLLVFAPVFIPAFLSMLFQWNRSRFLSALALVSIMFWIISGAWIDWHSGHCPPARYLVPLLPLIALFAADVFREPGYRARKIIWTVLWIASLLQVAGVAASIPETAIVHNDGINRLWAEYLPEWLPDAIPSWLNPGPGLTFSICGVILLTTAAMVMFVVPVRSNRKRAFGITVFLLSGAGLLSAGAIAEMNFRTEIDATPLQAVSPALVTPDDGTVWYDELPDLEWRPVKGADGYIVVMEFPDGRSMRIPQYGPCRLVLADSTAAVLPEGLYCWHIVATKHGNQGAESEKRCFQLYH